MNKKILVLGNATDRLDKKGQIKNWQYDLAICNYAYKEYLNFPNITMVGTVHDFVAKDILKFRKDNNLSFRILSNQVWETGIEPFKRYKGYSTGWELINQAILEDYEEIYICGFAVINNCLEDIYFPKGVSPVCDNFIKQYYLTKEEYPGQKILFL